MIRCALMKIRFFVAEDCLEMRPLDFSEFLLAMGEDMLMELIRLQFGKRQPMGPDMHRRAMMRLGEYLIVGGMPEAVEKYATTRDFDEADREKRRVLELRRREIRNRAGRQKGRVSLILDTIPGNSAAAAGSSGFRIWEVRPGSGTGLRPSGSLRTAGLP